MGAVGGRGDRGMVLTGRYCGGGGRGRLGVESGRGRLSERVVAREGEAPGGQHWGWGAGMGW